MKYVYILLVLLLLLFSCSIQNGGRYHNPKGNYEIKITKTASDANPVIKGRTFDQQTNESLPFTAIKINNKKLFRSDKKGNYEFSVSPGVYNYYPGTIGYRFFKTKRFRVHRGDTVTINFYLQDDPTPIRD
ncbi:hypothetical protein GCM10027037_24940 [Mucilaginibacter koreensis]